MRVPLIVFGGTREAFASSDAFTEHRSVATTTGSLAD
jgi:hypothetical protein